VVGRIAGGHVTDLTAAQTKTLLAITGADVAGLSNRNGIINGCFRVAQRGVAFTAATVPLNSDDAYLLDRWVLLSDGNDIVDVTQVTTPVPVGAYAAACFDIETEDKKWGILQILEARDSARFIGGTVSLSFKARRGASDTSTLLRAAVLSWASTADAVTSDVVNAWGNEGTNPTLVANWTAENTPAALAELTDAYQTFKIEGIAVDTASAVNIAVFIWSEDKTNAVGDLVYIADVQLELSAVATPFEVRSYATEMTLCARYAMAYTSTQNNVLIGFGLCQLNNQVGVGLPFATMRAIPTLTATAADWIVSDGVTATDMTGLALAANVNSDKCVQLSCTVAGTPLTQFRMMFLVADQAGRVLLLEAEL